MAIDFISYKLTELSIVYYLLTVQAVALTDNRCSESSGEWGGNSLIDCEHNSNRGGMNCGDVFFLSGLRGFPGKISGDGASGE